MKDINNINESANGKKVAQVIAGLVIVAAGVLLFMKRAGVEVPEWVFSWPMLVVVIGFLMVLKHRFRHFFGYIVMLVGGFFLAQKIGNIDMEVGQYILPALIILAGMAFIFKPRRKHYWKDDPRCQQWHERHKHRWHERHNRQWEWSDEKKAANGDDLLDETAVFGGIRKTVMSKDFKGGELVSVFGGMELDLSQADINGTAVLDVTVVFGGVRLVVPSHWEVKTQITNIAAGVDDKRSNPNAVSEAGKVLIISGEAVCGGIDIRSF